MTPQYRYDSPRKVLLDTLKRLCFEVRHGSYFVKRGAINWASFPWDRFPRGIAIMMDECTLFKPHSMNTGIATLEMAAKFDPDSRFPEIDDGLMEEFIDDIHAVIERLVASVDKSGNPVVFKDDKDARAIEFHDADLMVQGVIVSIEFGF